MGNLVFRRFPSDVNGIYGREGARKQDKNDLQRQSVHDKGFGLSRGPSSQPQPELSPKGRIQDVHRGFQRGNQRRRLLILSQRKPEEKVLKATSQMSEVHVLRRGVREEVPPKEEGCIGGGATTPGTNIRGQR